MFRLLIFYFVFLLKTRDIFSSEYRNACQLWNRSQVTIGLNTPSNTVKQKHFLILQNYFCELEAKYNSNERSQFGITFGFKNDKHCRRSDWLYPKIQQNQNGGHPYQCAFGVRSGDEQQNWSHNLIGLISLWTNHINYTLLPKGSDSLDSHTIRTLPLKFKDFIPTIAYNVYSRQNLNSIVFFEQKFRKLIQKWDLRVQVLNILEGEIQNVTDEALEELDISPDTSLRKMPLNSTQITPENRQNNGMESKIYIPRAILQTDRSLRIAGLFGIQIPADRSDPNLPNGTIILFKKFDSENFQSLWYCVTPEYNLSEECKSPEKYKLFMDCRNETFEYEEEEQIETTIVTEVQQTDTEFAEKEPTLPANVDEGIEVDKGENDEATHRPSKRSSSKLLMFVILIVVIIIVLVTCIAVICPNNPLKGYERRTVRMKSGPNIDNKGIDKSDGKSGSKSDSKSESKSESKSDTKNDSKIESYKKVNSVRSAMN